MAKYSGKTASTRRLVPTAPVRTKAQRTQTYNADEAYVRDAKSELFVLAVNFMGEQEQTYYESGDARQDRFVKLIHQVTSEDPEWMQQFIPWLRNDAFMRTASAVAAAEYVAARGPHGAAVIESAAKRADEPGEILGYWLAKYGRKLPMALKRGLARASNKLYNEFNALKYDGVGRGVRMGDVIELTHPVPRDNAQSVLFEYLLDRRHHPDEIRAEVAALPMIDNNRALRVVPADERREKLRYAGAEILQASGFTWESLSEWLPGGMDAEAWEFAISQMGFMALLRNLRNFDQAGISDVTVKPIIDKFTDPGAVAKSMQFPYRFYSAYKNVVTNRWAHALDTALDLSCSNIPKLSGKSLVLIDLSGSMCATLSAKSEVQNWEAATIFGVAQFRAAGFSGDLVGFGTDNEAVLMSKGMSILKGVEKVRALQTSGRLGWSTNMWNALSRHYSGHDRVLIFTDEQADRHFARQTILERVKAPIYFWNLGGYRPAVVEMGTNGRYEMAGLSDATFRQIALLEQFRDAGWPWQQDGIR